MASQAATHDPVARQARPARPSPLALAPHGGYLHIGPDWRITFAHLEGGRSQDVNGTTLVGQVLWDLYPGVLGTPFEEAYRKTMADRQPRVFEAVYGPEGLRLENRLFPAGDGIALVYQDVSARHAIEERLERRERQQESVARLGLAALEGGKLTVLLDQAVREVTVGLGTEFSKLVRLEPDGHTLLLLAGVGWKPGLVGHATVPADERSQSGYALKAHGPVIVEDLPNDHRFSTPPLLLDHGVVSGLSVLVGPRDAPFGVLGAHTAVHRRFDQDDLNYLQSVANLLGAALARRSVETELRRHRDDLEGLVRERTRLLEASNRELEAFSYSVSHDLRTPLRAIDGFSGLLARQYGATLPPAAQGLLEKVREGAQRMGHLIESLLALARIGRQEIVAAPVDLTAIATSILRDLAVRDPDRKVHWTVEPGLTVHGDPDLLRVLMDNLLGNAWKFTALKSKGHIEVGRTDQGDLFVRDNGAGFDPEHAGRLFEPFQRLHHATQFEGTGVGLAIVQRIAQRHGGRVWADGQPGKGATFHLTLAPPHAGP